MSPQLKALAKDQVIRDDGSNLTHHAEQQAYADRHAATIAAPFTKEEYSFIREWAKERRKSSNRVG